MPHGPLWRLWKLCGSFQNPETLGAVSVVEISTASAPPTAYYDFLNLSSLFGGETRKDAHHEIFL